MIVNHVQIDFLLTDDLIKQRENAIRHISKGK